MAAQIRATTQMALLSRDASDNIRRVTLRRAPGVVGDLALGAMVLLESTSGERTPATSWTFPG